MKSLEARIDRLEEQTKSKDGNLVLMDARGNQVDAVMVRKPTAETDGIAVLPDGSEMPIAHDEQCGEMVHFIPLRPETIAEWPEEPEEPIDTDWLSKDKLYLRRDPVFVFEGIEPDRFPLPDGDQGGDSHVIER